MMLGKVLIFPKRTSK